MKGKGYTPALEQPLKFHGLGRFEPRQAQRRRDTDLQRSVWPYAGEVCGNNQKIVAITGAMPSGTGLIHFAKEHPKRYYDVGIAEEHAALFAAGLACEGFKPFLAIYSTFMQRAYDMIIHDIALQNLNVALCMDRGGLSGDDGPTHHGLFDIGYLRHVPNIVHMQPKDEDEFVDMLWTMSNYRRPHRHPLPAWRRHRRAAEGSTASPRNRQGGSHQARQHRPSALPSWALAACANWPRSRRAVGSAGHFHRCDQSPLDQTARHP